MGQGGVFELRTPADLLSKLEADFVRLRSLPAASEEAQYAAFDFFVTAEHLPEWLAKATGDNLQKLRGYSDGRLVSHIANGAKHFRIDPKRHRAIRDTQAHPGAFQEDAFQSDAFDVPQLFIEHEDGRVETVVAVAARVLEYWKQRVA